MFKFTVFDGQLFIKFIGIETEDELFAVLGSVSLPEIVAVFVKFPVALTVAFIVKVAFAPFEKLPIVQTPVPEL